MLLVVTDKPHRMQRCSPSRNMVEERQLLTSTAPSDRLRPSNRRQVGQRVSSVFINQDDGLPEGYDAGRAVTEAIRPSSWAAASFARWVAFSNWRAAAAAIGSRWESGKARSVIGPSNRSSSAGINGGTIKETCLGQPDSIHVRLSDLRREKLGHNGVTISSRFHLCGRCATTDGVAMNTASSVMVRSVIHGGTSIERCTQSNRP